MSTDSESTRLGTARSASDTARPLPLPFSVGEVSFPSDTAYPCGIGRRESRQKLSELVGNDFSMSGAALEGDGPDVRVKRRCGMGLYRCITLSRPWLASSSDKKLAHDQADIPDQPAIPVNYAQYTALMRFPVPHDPPSFEVRDTDISVLVACI